MNGKTTAEVLRTLPTTTHIDFSKMKLGDTAIYDLLNKIGSNYNLRSLNLQGCNIVKSGDKLLAFAKSHPNIIELNISGNPKLPKKTAADIRKQVKANKDEYTFKKITKLGDDILATSTERYKALKKQYIPKKKPSKEEWEQQLKTHITESVHAILKACFSHESTQPFSEALYLYILTNFTQAIDLLVSELTQACSADGFLTDDVFKISSRINSYIMFIFYQLLTSHKSNLPTDTLTPKAIFEKNPTDISFMLTAENPTLLKSIAADQLLYTLMYPSQTGMKKQPKLLNTGERKFGVITESPWKFTKELTLELPSGFQMLNRNILYACATQKGRSFTTTFTQMNPAGTILLMALHVLKAWNSHVEKSPNELPSDITLFAITEKLKDAKQEKKFNAVLQNAGPQRIKALKDQLAMLSGVPIEINNVNAGARVITTMLNNFVERSGYSAELETALTKFRETHLAPPPVLLPSNFTTECQTPTEVMATIRLTEKSLERYTQYRVSDMYFYPSVKFSTITKLVKEKRHKLTSFPNRKVLCNIKLPDLGSVSYLHYSGQRHSGDSKGTIEFETQLFGSYNDFTKRVKDLKTQVKSEFDLNNKTTLEVIESLAKLTNPFENHAVLSPFIRQEIIDTFLPAIFTLFYIEPYRNPASFVLHPLAIKTAQDEGDTVDDFVTSMPMTKGSIAPAARGLHQSTSDVSKRVLSPSSGTADERNKLKKDQLALYHNSSPEDDKAKINYVTQFWKPPSLYSQHNDSLDETDGSTEEVTIQHI